MTEVGAEIPSNTGERSQSRLRKIGGEIVRPLAVVGSLVAIIYGAGAIRGNPVSSKPNVDVRLEQILEPKAVKIARQVLNINLEMNNNIVITKPDPNGDTPGEETVSISSITTDNEWITIDASMYRDENGQLDPTTVNDVDIQEYECDPPGPHSICGSSRHSSEEIEFLLGDNTTYTKGNWGLEDDLWLPQYKDPAITINTKTKSPTEVSDSKDALHAIQEAQVFSRVALMWAKDAMAGKIDTPKPKKVDNATTI